MQLFAIFFVFPHPPFGLRMQSCLHCAGKRFLLLRYCRSRAGFHHSRLQSENGLAATCGRQRISLRILRQLAHAASVRLTFAVCDHA